MLPVKELAADTGIGQNTFIPIALQSAFGDVQYPADICTVHIPVRGLRIEPAAYLRGNGRQFFQLVEDVYSCFLSDAYYLFHRFIVFRFNKSGCLCVRSDSFHSSRIRCARFFIIVRFCVFQPPLQDGLPTFNATIYGKLYDRTEVAVVGSPWQRLAPIFCIISIRTATDGNGTQDPTWTQQPAAGSVV